MRKDPLSKEEFYSRTYHDPNSGCMLWLGCLDKAKYGKIARHKKQWLAHRYSWFLTYGEFDLALKVLHKCDTPPCINPDHLFLGTQADNMKDCVKKKRTKAQKQTHCKHGHPLSGSNL